MATIVDFTFVPWGNAYINTTECGLPAAPGWEKTGYNGDAKQCWMKQCAADETKCVATATEPMICQHGPNECLVDRYEGCAMALNPSYLEYMPFVQCFEGSAASRAVVGVDTDPAAVHLAAQLCALVNSPQITWSALHACAAAGDELGDAQEKAMAIATAALNPPHLFTPWVTLNGVPQDPYPHFPADDDDPNHYNPLDHLLASVCGNYTGTTPLPAACSAKPPQAL